MAANGWQTALDALRPLEARLDAALAAGDVESAMLMAFAGASEAVGLMGDADAAPKVARWHRVYVEMTPLPLEAFGDGTLAENGTYVNLEYQAWPA